jgi:hypothetical protein
VTSTPESPARRFQKERGQGGLFGGGRLSQGADDLFATQAIGDVLKSEVYSCILPRVADGGGSIGGYDDFVARIGAMSRGVFDGKVGPGPGNHQRIDPVYLQDRVELAAVKRVHAHLLDNYVASGLGSAHANNLLARQSMARPVDILV